MQTTTSNDVSIAPPVSENQLVAVTRGLTIRNMEDLTAMAAIAAKSGLAPKGMSSPEQCFVAMQTGMEAGLTPMASLASVVVINGNPTWRGEAALALVRNSGKMQWSKDGFAGEGDERHFWIETQRRDEEVPHKSEFSINDAKRAKLWGRQGPWSEYPQRMLRWRCLGFHFKDYYPDVTRGLAIAEEVIDYPSRLGGGQSFDLSDPPAKDPLLEPKGGRSEVVSTQEPQEATEAPSEPAESEAAPEPVAAEAAQGEDTGGQMELPEGLK